jgi:hypothetical protein
LAEPFRSQRYATSGSDWAYFFMVVIGNQSDGLTIPPVFLDSEGHLQLFWDLNGARS